MCGKSACNDRLGNVYYIAYGLKNSFTVAQVRRNLLIIIKPMPKRILALALAAILATSVFPALAADEGAISASQAGGSESEINNASSEATKKSEIVGSLIEIGNTTADNTTIVIRTTDANGQQVDQTIEVEKKTKLQNAAGGHSSLGDWIAGDQIVITGIMNTNSGEFVASRIRNMTMLRAQRGVNGWIKEIRTEKSEVDITYGNKTITLKISSTTRIVAGLKNPAVITDLLTGDRIRARAEDDRDGNPATWNAKTLVVLRRGTTLFMRVTRWVFPAKIVSLPDDTSTMPAVMTVEILSNRFYQKGDVNNLIGAPGEKIEVVVGSSTHLMRRFRGKCLLDEFTEGDEVNIIGRLDSESGRVDANVIKNNSIQKLGVWQMVGTVQTIDSANRTLSMKLGRNSQKEYTIKAESSTKVYKRNVKALNEVLFSEIKVGDMLRTRGVYNRRSKAVSASVIVILPSSASTTASSTDATM